MAAADVVVHDLEAPVPRLKLLAGLRLCETYTYAELYRLVSGRVPPDLATYLTRLRLPAQQHFTPWPGARGCMIEAVDSVAIRSDLFLVFVFVSDGDEDNGMLAQLWMLPSERCRLPDSLPPSLPQQGTPWKCVFAGNPLPGTMNQILGKWRSISLGDGAHIALSISGITGVPTLAIVRCSVDTDAARLEMVSQHDPRASDELSADDSPDVWMAPVPEDAALMLLATGSKGGSGVRVIAWRTWTTLRCIQLSAVPVLGSRYGIWLHTLHLAALPSQQGVLVAYAGIVASVKPDGAVIASKNLGAGLVQSISLVHQRYVLLGTSYSAVGRERDRSGRAILWNWETGEVVASIKTRDSPQMVAILRNGLYMYTACKTMESVVWEVKQTHRPAPRTLSRRRAQMEPAKRSENAIPGAAATRRAQQRQRRRRSSSSSSRLPGTRSGKAASLRMLACPVMQHQLPQALNLHVDQPLDREQWVSTVVDADSSLVLVCHQGFFTFHSAS